MRLDVFLVENKYYLSRSKASQAIERGEIFVDGVKIIKPSFDIKDNYLPKIEKKATVEYVSLGGYKLEKALKDFNFNVKGLTVADFGASTGGFTDCLIQNGAKKVYAIDLNDTLLDERLKQDERVISLIKNVKDVKKEDFNEDISLITADLSFISEKIVLPVISSVLKENSFAIILIKPQFEIDGKQKFKNGIVKDKKIHKRVCEKIYNASLENNLTPKKLTKINAEKGKNIEFLMLVEKFGKEITLNIEDFIF